MTRNSFWDFIFGGPTPVEPDLLASQHGAVSQPGMTPRMNVLPVTVDPQTQQFQLVLPRALDIAGNILSGAVPKIARGLDATKALSPAEAALAEVARLNEATAKAYRPAAKTVADPVDEAIAQIEAALGKPPPTVDPEMASLTPFLQEALKSEANFGITPPPGVPQPKTIEEAFAAHPSIDNWLRLPPEKQSIDMLQDWQQSNVELGPKGWQWTGPSLEQKPWTEADAADLWMEQNPGPVKPKADDYIAPESWRSKKAGRMLYEEDLVGPPVPTRDLDPTQRMQRSIEQGWGMFPGQSDQLVLYTGVPTWGEVKPLGFKDPQLPYKTEKAVFLSPEPDIATRYAGEGIAGPGYSGGVIPVFMRSEKPFEYNWKGEQYDAQLMESLIDEALAGGHDSAIMRNMRDLGGVQDQYLAFNPNQLRSIFAKFDPKNLHANDLTAALAAALGLGTVANETTKK